jgi:hypothetical protein
VLNEIVQQGSATSLNAEQMGSIAAMGLVNGNPFPPDARMKKILAEAAAVGNAASRTLFMSARDPSWSYYPGSSRSNLLFQTCARPFLSRPPSSGAPRRSSTPRHDFDSRMTTRFAGVVAGPTGAGGTKSTAAFFDFVQNLTDFMQAISRAQRLVSPVFRR